MTVQNKATADRVANKMTIEQAMPGAEILTAGDEQVAIGFPEEVVKAWMLAGASPTAWLVPDVRVVDGIVQWAMEFPLYFALFIQGKFARREKVRVLVHERDWNDVVEYLRLTLLGLTRKELTRAGVDAATVDMLVAEGDYLALKREDGSPAGIEDFLDPCFFGADNSVDLGGLRIQAHGDNTWSFYTEADRIEEHRLTIEGEQLPPYSKPLNPGTSPVIPQPFEVITLGTANGFDPTGPCSNLLVQANGRFVLVDSGPYIGTLLRHAGISLNQVDALVITHAHEDHAVGLSALLDLTHRLKLFITRENAEIMQRKLALLNPGVSHPERLLSEAFDVVTVGPGEDYDFLGLRLRFHYTMHAIPCTGVELAMRHGNDWRKVLIVGDHNSRANVARAAEEGILPPERLADLERIYSWKGDLLVADAGAGQIHGMPTDYRDNPSADMVCVHTSTLEESDRHLYSLAEPGYRYTIIPESGRPSTLERGLAHRALVETFGVTDPDPLNALLDAAVPVSVNRGHIVVRHQDRTRDLFITLTGELAVLAEVGDKPVEVATIHAGELFGEMAVVNGAPRSASVRAATPARLVRVPGDVFERFANAAGLVASLPDLWDKRSALERAGILADASVTTRNRIARHAVRKGVEPGATLIREGSRSNTVFVLVQGRVQVYRGTEPLMVSGRPVIVGPGSLLGETAPFLKQARNASIVTVDECEVLAIRGADFRRIVEDSPHLFCSISQVVRKRQAA